MNYKTYQFENEIRREISALSKLDNWHCFLALIENYMIIFLMAAACSAFWYLYPLAALIIGSLMRNQINLYMSRNRHSHWLENFLTGMHNESYHLVHHLNPTIPFWNLPKAHQIYLRDKNYALFDRQAGGIFISANHAPILIQSAIISLRSQSQKKL
ncbi:MAG: fatty acid desaturase [Phormidium sp.]